MTDPNLVKIIESNVEEIEKGNIGRTITHASSYLDYIYGYNNRDKRKIELTQFIEKLKLLANSLKLKKINNGVENVQKRKRQQKKRQNRRY